MSKSLRAPVSVEAPRLDLDAAEWQRLAAATSSRDMNERWTVDIARNRVSLVRSGRFVIYEGMFSEGATDSRQLKELRVEGDTTIFNRSGFSSDTEVGALFVDVIRQIIDRH